MIKNMKSYDKEEDPHTINSFENQDNNKSMGNIVKGA